MVSKLRRFVSHLRENFEIYGIFLAFVFLTVLEISHVKEPHKEPQWIETAILITLLLVAVASTRDRHAYKELGVKIDRMTEGTGGELGVKWYPQRNDAFTEMLSDLASFKHVAFLGISQKDLCDYLKQAIEKGGVLPWESLKVFFASERLGEAYEGNRFESHVKAARQEIASLLTQPANVSCLPQFGSVRFFQHNGIATHTGSVYSNDTDLLAVIYVVHSRIQLAGDTKEGLTIRLQALPHNSPLHQMRLDYYSGIYANLGSASRDLGVFRRTVWDESAQQWSSYSRHSAVLKRSMLKLAEMAALQNNETVLDLGAGSGEHWEALLHTHPGISSAVLLDASPQMVGLARDYFRNNSKVCTALCTVPANDGSDIDLSGETFSLIVVHQALRELVDACGNADNLAVWCRDRLRPGGRVVLAAHNGALDLSPPQDWEAWEDPFRSELVRRLRHAAGNLRTPSPRLSQKEIEGAFLRQEFDLAAKETSVDHQFSYEDRRRMWHVPAVLDSVVDVSRVDRTMAANAVESAVAPLMPARTMPRTMVFWRFDLRPV